jgi:hypothetical protein
VLDQLRGFLASALEFFSDFRSPDSLARVIILPIFFSGFGAFAGGLIAYKFRTREETYRRAKESLKKSTIACGLASAMCGTAISMKRQIILPTAQRYRGSRETFLQRRQDPTIREPLTLEMDLYSFMPPASSAKEVLDAIVSIGPGDGRNVPQAIALLECSNNLNELCKSRNEWIEDFRKLSEHISNDARMKAYFGVEDENGARDERYLHFTENLVEAIDGIIFHSFELYCRVALSLVDDAEAFRKRHGEKHTFFFTDFTGEVANGLFPSREDFSNWLEEPLESRKKLFETRTAYLEKQRKHIRSNYSGKTSR